MQYSVMSPQFEAEKNKQALLYTTVICGCILLLLLLKVWSLPVLHPPVAQELIEINLGNDMEGFGEEQPLIKGEMSDNAEPQPAAVQQPAAPAKEEAVRDAADDTEKDETAAPVTKPAQSDNKAPKIADKPANNPVKTNTTAPPAPAPAPKPKLPLYKGPGNGNGNGATEDNGYRYQGNKPGGTGDAGSPNGKPDSYGTNPGGRSGGGPRVTSGDRKIIKYYSFRGDLEKATIYAIIRVSPAGTGTFAGFGKNSTARSEAYANAIRQHLSSIKFDPSDHESTVTVQFNFTVN